MHTLERSLSGPVPGSVARGKSARRASACGRLPILLLLSGILTGCAGGPGTSRYNEEAAASTTETGSGTATVSWTAPTDRNDGGPLTNLAGFRIRYGKAKGDYYRTITVYSPQQTQYVVKGLTPGTTYYFVVTAFDALGVESHFSTEVSRRIEEPPAPASSSEAQAAKPR